MQSFDFLFTAATVIAIFFFRPPLQLLLYWDVRLKILRLPSLNMLFQLVLTRFFKSELFSCLPKVDHVITVLQRAYSYKVSYPIFLSLLVFNMFVGMIQKRIRGHLLPV